MRADSTGLFVSGCAAAFYLLRSSQTARASRPSKPSLTFGATTVSSGGVTPRPKLLSPSAARAFAAEGARAPYNGAKNNPKPHETITDSSTLGTSGDRLVIVMVGLPGEQCRVIGAISWRVRLTCPLPPQLAPPQAAARRSSRARSRTT